jgi:hypothetical protein
MKKFYLLASIVLFSIGAGLIYGGLYASNFVRDNLIEQKITFPDTKALEAQNRNDLVKYAGSTVDSGDKAKTFAGYIQGHIAKIADGKTYSEVSGEYQKLSAEQKEKPEGKKLEAQRMSIFMGETLRGTLLNAYGWGFVGKIAFYSGIGLAAAGGVSAALFIGSGKTHKPAKRSTKKKK